MAYQPKEFDRIRLEMEGKTLHHNDYLWLERLAVWLFIGFTASVVVITLLFAVKADALETVNIDGNFALSSIYSDGLYNSDKNYHVQLAPNLWAKLSAGVSVPGWSGIDMAIGFGSTSAVSSVYSGSVADCTSPCSSAGTYFFTRPPDDRYSSSISNSFPGSVFRKAQIFARATNAFSPPNRSFLTSAVQIVYDLDGNVYDWTTANDFYYYHAGALRKIIKTGLDIDYRRWTGTEWVSDGTVLAPGVMASPYSFPIYVETEAFTPWTETPVFYYLGNDSHFYAFIPHAAGGPIAYRMDTGEFSGNSILDLIQDMYGGSASGGSIPSLLNKRPFSIIEPASNNFITLAQDDNDGYWTVLARTITINGYWEDEGPFSFIGVSAFVNPKAYIARLDGTHAIWDVACIEPGYDLCQNTGTGGYRCLNESDEPGPNNLSCNYALDIPEYFPSTGQENCTGAWCIGSGTGSNAISGLSEFLEYVGNCDTDNDGETTLTEGISCIWGAPIRFFGGILDKFASVWQSFWAIIEETLKTVKPTGTGGENLFGSFQLIPKAAAADNEIVLSLKSGITDFADGDNFFSRYFDFLYWGIILLGVLVGVFTIAQLKRK